MADDPTTSDSTSGDVRASRLEKLRNIEALGVDPWGQRFDGHMPIQTILALPADLPEATSGRASKRPGVSSAGASRARSTSSTSGTGPAS